MDGQTNTSGGASIDGDVNTGGGDFVGRDKIVFELSFRKIVNHVSCNSTPIFGMQWQPPVSEIEIARRLIIFLEDRRVLSEAYYLVLTGYAIESVLQIRGKLTDELSKVESGGLLDRSIRTMRAACREFLSALEKIPKDDTSWLKPVPIFQWIMKYEMAKISLSYGVDIHGPLAWILNSMYPSLKFPSRETLDRLLTDDLEIEGFSKEIVEYYLQISSREAERYSRGKPNP